MLTQDDLPEVPAPARQTPRPSQTQAEEAVRTLIRWAGDDPDRPGLAETPSRMSRAFEEFFSGYRQDPAEILAEQRESVPVSPGGRAAFAKLSANMKLQLSSASNITASTLE